MQFVSEVDSPVSMEIENHMSSRTLYLFSPVPPAKSGTADYMDALLQHLPAAVSRRFNVVFACEPRQLQPFPRDFRHARVMDFRKVTPTEQDVCLYFIANNEYHRFALAALRQHRSGLVVAMIHDLQCLQNVAAACALGEYGFTRAHLQEHIEGELGAGTVEFTRAVWNGSLPRLFTYLCLAQSVTLKRSAAILVHSYYARSRLLLETQADHPVPPIYVVQHPSDEETSPLSQQEWHSHQARDRFVVSTFGWVAPAKRTYQIIESFARFHHGLSADERQCVELRVVGQLPPRDYYDPVGKAKASGIATAVRFSGYVSLAKLQEHMSQSHLVFNLRFPSCGETSGTLRRCQDLRIPVATTDYAAFREESADFRVSADPMQETGDILAAINSAYACWRETGSTHRLADTAIQNTTPKMPFWEAFLLATDAASKRVA